LNEIPSVLKKNSFYFTNHFLYDKLKNITNDSNTEAFERKSKVTDVLSESVPVGESTINKCIEHILSFNPAETFLGVVGFGTRPLQCTS